MTAAPKPCVIGEIWIVGTHVAPAPVLPVFRLNLSKMIVAVEENVPDVQGF